MPLVLGKAGRPRDSGEIAEPDAPARVTIRSGRAAAAGSHLLKRFQSGNFAT
jgi:hypothetical protein